MRYYIYYLSLVVGLLGRAETRSNDSRVASAEIGLIARPPCLCVYGLRSVSDNIVDISAGIEMGEGERCLVACYHESCRYAPKLGVMTPYVDSFILSIHKNEEGDIKNVTFAASSDSNVSIYDIVFPSRIESARLAKLAKKRKEMGTDLYFEWDRNPADVKFRLDLSAIKSVLNIEKIPSQIRATLRFPVTWYGNDWKLLGDVEFETRQFTIIKSDKGWEIKPPEEGELIIHRTKPEPTNQTEPKASKQE